MRKFHPASAGFFLASNSAATAAKLPTSSFEELRIAGLTGVDVELEIAGPGSRSHAFLIDWQIRVVFALGWLALAAFARRHLDVPWVTRAKFSYLGVAPALAIYLLYHPLLEVCMQGRTPGKRRAGVRLVTRSGGTPGVGALLIRNVFRLIDCLPSFYLVGLLCCFLTQQRVRIGDLAAGTLLVVDARQRLPTSALNAVAQGELTPAAAELIEELLERWDALDATHRATLARTLLARVDGSSGSPAAAGVAAAMAAADDGSDFQLRERLRSALAVRTGA